ncbi:MAG: hypothetical protein KatS3mg057_2394 [Herpetosiphonaceae bacterium]|nr:MAG: hypothetical protein KatS3mg057_2394 [Herpetosiphonaceae bacterium]
MASIEVRTAVTINRSPHDVYSAWRALENIPRFMRHIESISQAGERRSHWVARGPAGLRLSWDAEIVADQEGELIAWRSLPGADVENHGLVRFKPAPGDRGTEVHALIRYRLPGGVLGQALGNVFNQGAGRLIQGDLRRFKQLMEAGEISTTEGQPSGRQREREHGR